MLDGIPKISVLIICYKQEDLIKRAIDSLLVQKEYIYEICVSDDCSLDKTWDVLLEYEKQNPGLFKLHQNRPNLGIFENIEYSWKMPIGDIIYRLAGDDVAGEGWFRKVVEYIQKNKIDYKNELFCIYGDYNCIYPNGDIYTFKNEQVASGNDVMSLALRGMICNRSSCYSINVLKKFITVSQGRSYIAEIIQDRQLQVFSEKNYYIPYIGNTYYTNVGVSTHIENDHFEERQGMMDYYISFLEGQNIKVSKADRNYAKCFNAIFQYMHYKKICHLYDFIKYYIYSYNPKFGDELINIRHLYFAIRRRLPHYTPIKM